MNQKKVSRRPYKDTGLTLPLLGLGLMRLPQKEGQIDQTLACRMVDLCMQYNCNYFDTAYFYHEGKSENFAKEALSKYPRDSYFLTTKMPTSMLKQKADLERIFQEQQERTGAGYFDFYLMHWLNDDHWKLAQELDLYTFMKEKQAQGQIRRLGFSYHGDPVLLDKIAGTYPWDIAQIQLNYLDWELMRAKEQYEVLTRHGIPVLVMEPLRGGALANLPPEARKCCTEFAPEKSTASWGLRFAASLPNVITVLSGMSTLEQLQENLDTFSPLEELNEKEHAVLLDVLAAYRKTRSVPCTKCSYCMPCPAGVNIPWNLAVYNQMQISSSLFTPGLIYRSMTGKERASSCIKCGLCLTKCPQKIRITEHLEKVKTTMEEEEKKKT